MLTSKSDNTFNYQKLRMLDERKVESARIMVKYPDRIPVIVEKTKGSDVPDIDKCKFLIPKDFNFSCDDPAKYQPSIFLTTTMISLKSNL